MRERQEVIAFCLGFPNAYEDYPFHDPNWAVMRLKDSRRAFAFVYEREGLLCVNIKSSPDWILVWREAFPGVIPGYHMNKKYWNTILLDGTVPDKEVKRMIAESYDLVKEKKNILKQRR